MDPFNSRDNEKDIFAIVRQSEVDGAEDIGPEDIGANDGSQFLNEDPVREWRWKTKRKRAMSAMTTRKLVDIRRLADRKSVV